MDPSRIHMLQVKDLWTEFWIYANSPSGVLEDSGNPAQGTPLLPKTKRQQEYLWQVYLPLQNELPSQHHAAC